MVGCRLITIGAQTTVYPFCRHHARDGVAETHLQPYIGDSATSGAYPSQTHELGQAESFLGTLMEI